MLVATGTKVTALLQKIEQKNEDSNSEWKFGSGISKSGRILVHCSSYMHLVDAQHTDNEQKVDGSECDFDAIAEIKISVCDLSWKAGKACPRRLTRHSLRMKQSESSIKIAEPEQHLGVIVSPNEQYVACLLPAASIQMQSNDRICHVSNIIVVFDLESIDINDNDDDQLANDLPTLPAFLDFYDTASSNKFDDAMPLVEAVNPRIIICQDDDEQQQHQLVTAICNTGEELSRFFLAGCANGNILVLEWTWRDTRAIALLDNEEHYESSRQNALFQIRAMDCGSDNLLAICNAENELLIYSLTIRKSNFADIDTGITSSYLKVEQIKRTKDVGGQREVACIRWVGKTNILAVTFGDQCSSCENKEDFLVQLWNVSMSSGRCFMVSSVTSHCERIQRALEETPSYSFDVDENDNMTTYKSHPALHYEDSSGSLTVSTFVRSAPKIGHDSTKRRCISFVWDWRSNVIGTIISTRDMYSNIFLGHRGHILTNIFMKKDRILVEFHDVAKLCPNVCMSDIAYECCQPYPLFLTPTSVGVAATKPNTASKLSDNSSLDLVVNWKENIIPVNYTSLYGPALIATTVRDCHSIAIASKRGLCVLDNRTTVSRKQQPHPVRQIKSAWSKTGTSRAVSIRGDHSSNIPTPSGVPKWRIFGKENEESSFCVRGFQWWERGTRNYVNDEKISDDLLIAIVQTKFETDHARAGQGSDDLTYWLRCWSNKRLALGQDQLLRDFRFLENTEGVIVHLSEPPQVFSLLKNPRSSDHCLLLVATTTGSFQYKIFQLQVNQSKNVCVAANLWIQGEIEDENFKYSNAFIAGGTFLFDLIRRADGNSENANYITVGIISKCGELLAATITNDNIIKGKVVHTHHHQSLIVSRCWMSDIVSYKEKGCFVWSIAFIDGTIRCWMVPLDYSDLLSNKFEPERYYQSHLSGQHLQMPLPVHLQIQSAGNTLTLMKDGILGYISGDLGGTMKWISGAASYNGDKAIMGTLPGSVFGSLIYAGQGVSRRNSDNECYFVSAFSIEASANASPILVYLIVAASNEIEESSSRISFLDSETALQAAMNLLRNDPFTSQPITTLSTLILRIVLFRYETRKDPDASIFSSILLSKVANLAENALRPLHFVSIYIGIARQIEPSVCEMLFPVCTNDISSYTVEDLSWKALKLGAYGLAASALPLYKSRESAHRDCLTILSSALSKIGSSQIKSETAISRQLFRFGVKIEGVSYEKEVPNHSSQDDVQKRCSNETDIETNKSFEGGDNTFLSDEMSSVASYINHNTWSESIVSKLRKTILCGIFTSKREQVLLDEYMEDVITHAASTFIVASVFDDEVDDDGMILQKLKTESPTDSTHFQSTPTKETVVGVVVNHLLSIIIMNPDHESGWRRVSVIADNLLYNEDDEDLASVDEGLSSTISMIANADDIHLHDSDHRCLVGLEQCPLVCKLLMDFKEFSHHLEEETASLIMRLIITLASAEKQSTGD